VVIDAIIDTSVIIDYLRGYPPARLWLLSQQAARFAITPVIWLETVQGAVNKVERDRAVRLLQSFIMEFPNEADHRWPMRQHALYYLGHGVHWSDVLIASVAVRLGVPLFTQNVKHYAALPNVDEQKPY
jgi:predicted nucleic acid-binding protein